MHCSKSGHGVDLDFSSWLLSAAYSSIISPAHAQGERTMDSAGFFDYPDDTPLDQSSTLLFLPDLSEDDWSRVLSFTQCRAFRAKETVLKIGDSGRALYIVSRGALEVAMPQKRGRVLRIARLAEGAVFGEQAFLDGQPRSATVQAVTDGEMHVLSLESFEILAARHPDLARMMLMDLGRILSMRLRRTMEMAVDGIG
ncbi:Crp/Fnr family transcriptional regulator [Simplicispira suum]|uniref:Crp/Fnr family transcriptional regulator n=1 Tax=Simplicispira suum TaxID=2109915 RepID=UPI002354314F|nr:cyclic nucleotide-binding domain-containing protein [Simplicispira suum]